MSAVLDKLYSSLVSGGDCPSAQQKEMIPLLKLCIKTSKVLCLDGDRAFPNDYCDATMSKILKKLDAEIKCELINVLYKEKEMELTFLHYVAYPIPSSLDKLVSKQSSHLSSLKLHCCGMIMPESCSYINLHELYLCKVSFQHFPFELTHMPCLSTLVFRCVSGIPDVLYRQL